MRVLYLTGMYPTPNLTQKGIFCHEQVKALKAVGVDVTVVVPVAFYDRSISVKEWEYEGVKIQYVRFFKLPGIRDYHKMGKALFKRLDKKLDLKAFDVYHADSPLPTGQAMMLASKKYGVPYIVHGHGLDVFFDVSYAGAKNCDKIASVCAQVYQDTNAIVGVSQKVLDKIQERLDVKDKAFVAYNGVDVEDFCPIEKDDDGIYKIISVGNLIPLKGHEYLIRALAEMKENGVCDFICTIVGGGELEEYLKNLTRELGLEDKVTFTGYIPYVEVKKWMQRSNVFALPSDYEAIGCVYLEAMACGVPAIGCLKNGIDEIIVHGENGYLVEGKNVEQLKECLIALTDKKLREKMGELARKTVVDNCQWKHSALAVKAVYERVCKG